jgi:hypothetical protein
MIFPLPWYGKGPMLFEMMTDEAIGRFLKFRRKDQ